MSLHILVVIAYAASPATAHVDRLPKNLEKAVGQVSVAYAQNQPLGVLKVLGPLCPRLKGKKLDTFNRALENLKIPPVSELLVEARLALLAVNRAKALPKSRLPETLLILGPLRERIKADLVRAAEPIEVAAEIDEPATLEDFETLLRSHRQQQHQVRTTELTATYAQDLADRVSARARTRLKPEARSLFAKFDGKAVHDASQLRQQLLEREIKLRLKRLAYGIAILENPTLTKERFLAAHSTGIDAKILQALLEPDHARTPRKKVKKPQKQDEEEPTPARFVSHELNRPELPDEVSAQGKRAAELGGDLVYKASLFSEGLDWWLRGRFGRGPAVGGFVKSEAAAKQAEALFVLEMPVDFPELKEPRLSDGLPASHIDRRHHYIWGWEDRRLSRSSNIIDRPNSSGDFNFRNFPKAGIGGGRTMAYYPHTAISYVSKDNRTVAQTNRIPPLQRASLYRLVGFVEYGKALELLGSFVEEASSEEFEIANQIVHDHDEFLIYTNLSRKIEKPSLLSEHDRTDEFARRGLNWVLALARVELGAMLAGFTDIKQPFQSFQSTPPKLDKKRILRTERSSSESRPERFGENTDYPDAYGEVLIDALRTHYWALMQDPEIRKYNIKGVPENHLLTYGRRTYVTLLMHEAVWNYAGARWSSEQLAELTRWKADIASIHRKYVYCLSIKLGVQETDISVERKSYAFKSGAGGLNPNRIYSVGHASPHRTKVGKTRRIQHPLSDLLLLVDPTLAGCGCQ